MRSYLRTITKQAVDGLAVCSFDLPPANAVTLAEQFGLSISWAYLGTAGGAGPIASVINAMRAIDAGHASVVLCLAGDAYDVAGHFRMMDSFNRALRNYGAPTGFGGANGLFGIIQRKHMETYGTRRDQLGRIAIGHRESATQNPNALFRVPLSLEEYLNAESRKLNYHIVAGVAPPATERLKSARLVERPYSATTVLRTNFPFSTVNIPTFGAMSPCSSNLMGPLAPT
jgi:acetyl-CoA acetyltransferase